MPSDNPACWVSTHSIKYSKHPTISTMCKSTKSISKFLQLLTVIPNHLAYSAKHQSNVICGKMLEWEQLLNLVVLLRTNFSCTWSFLVQLSFVNVSHSQMFPCSLQALMYILMTQMVFSKLYPCRLQYLSYLPKCS